MRRILEIVHEIEQTPKWNLLRRAYLYIYLQGMQDLYSDILAEQIQEQVAAKAQSKTYN